jgi:hypothetical protein
MAARVRAGYKPPVEAQTYLELARREFEQARSERERGEAAERFALRQVDEGLRDHFLRVAGRAEMEAVAHTARARRYEASASKQGERSKRAAERGASEANAELVRRVLATCLRDDFHVAARHLPERVGAGASSS